MPSGDRPDAGFYVGKQDYDVVFCADGPLSDGVIDKFLNANGLLRDVTKPRESFLKDPHVSRVYVYEQGAPFMLTEAERTEAYLEGEIDGTTITVDVDFTLSSSGSSSATPCGCDGCSQWNLENHTSSTSVCDADIDALGIPSDANGEGAVVAVIDRAFLPTPAASATLGWSLWRNPGQGSKGDGDGNGLDGDVHGWNFDDDSPDFAGDIHQHGTQAAAIIGGGPDYRGLAPKASIMLLEVDRSFFSIASAFEYAIREKADVISLSIDMERPTGCLRRLLSMASDAGVLVVASAGNRCCHHGQGVSQIACGRADENLLVVGSTDHTDRLAFNSSAGHNVDIFAPGHDVLLVDGERSSGTSWATPQVAALAALLYGRDSNARPKEVRERILRASDTRHGRRRLNGCRAFGAKDCEVCECP